MNWYLRKNKLLTIAAEIQRFFFVYCFNKGGNLCTNQGSHGYKVNVLDHLNLTIVLLCVGNASDAGLILKASKFQSKYLF